MAKPAIVIINHVSSIIIFWAFGISNLAISRSNPFCGDNGHPPLPTWEMVTGILQIVVGCILFWTTVCFCGDDTWCTNPHYTNIVCFFVAHGMNIVMAIVGAISISVSWNDCMSTSYNIWLASLVSIISAFAFVLIYIIVFIVVKQCEHFTAWYC
jgi:hypothetical protein